MALDMMPLDEQQRKLKKSHKFRFFNVFLIVHPRIGHALRSDLSLHLRC